VHATFPPKQCVPLHSAYFYCIRAVHDYIPLTQCVLLFRLHIGYIYSTYTCVPLFRLDTRCAPLFHLHSAYLYGIPLTQCILLFHLHRAYIYFTCNCDEICTQSSVCTIPLFYVVPLALCVRTPTTYKRSQYLLYCVYVCTTSPVSTSGIFTGCTQYWNLSEGGCSWQSHETELTRIVSSSTSSLRASPIWGKAYSRLSLFWSWLLWIPAVWCTLREFAHPIALVIYKLLLR
jgi:hypothetical protein